MSKKLGAPQFPGRIHVEMVPVTCAFSDVLLYYSMLIVQKESKPLIHTFNLLPCVAEGSLSTCLTVQGILSNEGIVFLQ
jgi:hypothetical protein